MCTGSFSWKANLFLCEKFCTRTLETDVQSNSEMAYLLLEKTHYSNRFSTITQWITVLII